MTRRGKGEKCPKCGYRVPRPFKSWVIDRTKVSAWACICGNRWRTARVFKIKKPRKRKPRRKVVV